MLLVIRLESLQNALGVCVLILQEKTTRALNGQRFPILGLDTLGFWVGFYLYESIIAQNFLFFSFLFFSFLFFSFRFFSFLFLSYRHIPSIGVHLGYLKVLFSKDFSSSQLKSKKNYKSIPQRRNCAIYRSSMRAAFVNISADEGERGSTFSQYSADILYGSKVSLD